ncbi:MAG: hypothetical protein IE916_03030 [Epsilonproteobacteria bacterium]|nr:hypothetical protein [Campylobacterota bacterium]
MPKRVELFFITLSSPLQIGIYEDGLLIEKIVSEEKSSDYLPHIYRELSEKYEIEGLYYTNGPGSFMAIKISYIFLKSISIIKNIPLYGADAFNFNQNQPIKAIGKLHFVKISDKIGTQKFENIVTSRYELPQKLIYNDFMHNAAPLYSIGAV